MNFLAIETFLKPKRLAAPSELPGKPYRFYTCHRLQDLGTQINIIL